MKALLLAVLAAFPVTASANGARKYINFNIYGHGNNYNVSEPSLRLNLHVNAYRSNYSFSGQPFSGNISKSGSYFHINGGGLNATVNLWGGNYSVDGTIHDTMGRPGTLHLSFTLNVIGRTDDPANPPSYSVHDGRSGSSLRLDPTGRGNYRVSGNVDEEKFGVGGTALVSLVAIVASHSLQNREPAPEVRSEALQAPVSLPALRGASLPSLPFPLK